ncbi:hypothetical protein [Actinoplanes flavus]|uniref:Uncharacterized protein n=1 Tax=Actinoplanes flavus TaxID=2820290 RepID=A0ABS3UWK0_9ACTN|nr:hypothetical protein [Actinoplanes flavus]MBO3742945.1 hypothetical protein [Actinoplanes flavus]
MRSTAEFDAFGPWIDEVTDVDGLPRLYRDSGLDPRAHRLVLKVPRDIERRNADPHMHLYDYVIAVGDEVLTVLIRREDSYGTAVIPLDRIAAVRDSVRLLDGRLTIHTLDGPALTIPYNGSAGGAVRDLIRVLREAYLPAGRSGAADPYRADPHVGPEDIGLLTAYRRLIDREPGMRLLNVSYRQHLRHRMRLVVMPASIVVGDDHEWQILHRRDWFTQSRDDLSLARTILPRARIDHLWARPHERYQHVHVIAVRSGATTLEIPVVPGPFSEALVPPG